MKIFLEREAKEGLSMFLGKQVIIIRNKVGAGVAAVRRLGAVHTLDTMDHFFLANEMVLVGRGVGFGREAGEVEKDTEGIQQVKSLGQRMAWLLKKIHG
jgi:multimeric flavodoxin WrbA